MRDCSPIQQNFIASQKKIDLAMAGATQPALMALLFEELENLIN